MLDVSTALNVLKSFGYNSLSIPPYIYSNGENVGVCYSFFDELYGNLDRVAMFKDQDEMKTFLKQFDWYKQNSEKYNIKLQLDDYEAMTPIISYFYDDQIIDYAAMLKLEREDYLSNKQREKHIKVINDLITMYESFKHKNDEVQNQVLIFECELENLRNAIEELKNTYKKIKSSPYNQLKPETIIAEPDIAITNMKNELAKISNGNSKKEFEDLLTTALHNLKKQESDEETLKTIFHLKELNLNMNALNVQQEEFLRLLSARRSFFANKGELDKCFSELESKKIWQMLPVNDLIAKEKAVIDSKYNYLKEMPINDLIPFLSKANEQSNENLSDIANEFIKQTTDLKNNLSKEKIFADLVNHFNNLETDITRALILYNSPLRKMFDYLYQVRGYEGLKIEELIKELELLEGYNQEKNYFLEEFSEIVDDVDNVSVKHLYFSVIDFKSHEGFLGSLAEQMKLIKSSSGILPLKHDLNIYLPISTTKNKLSILTPMTLTNSAILRYLNENDNHIIIGKLKVDSAVVVIPKEIKLSDNEKELRLYDSTHNEIFVNTKEVVAKKTGKNKTVAKYRSISEESNNYDIIIISDMNLAYRNIYGMAEVTTSQNKKILEG